jgi:lipopolysaccharide transport system ATP-binding protein
MSSDDVAVRVESVSKRYELYNAPRDRLKQFVLPHVRRAARMAPVDYFREFWALRDVSFEVRKGESVGIVGRNGSGKSTLLQIITGTLAPTSGQVETRGRIAALLELGSGFNPEFTGRENVFLNGALLGFSREQMTERFDAIAAFADIGEYLEQPVKTYSSGMLVRLAFAVQVQVEPAILIVDEALAVGDALFQKRCFQRLEQLIANGTSLLFVSHDQETIRTLTSRALLLDHGAPVAWGISSHVVLQYRALLHEDEKAMYRRYAEAARKAPPATAAAALPVTAPPSDSAVAGVTPHQKLKSFGYLEAEIVGVALFDGAGRESNYFQVGEPISFVVTFRANIELRNLNVAFRIRNKEGVKITSWGTLNDDMRAAHEQGRSAGLFWNREFAAGQVTRVRFSAPCRLGANFYELQVTVTREHDMYYGSQEVLHWRDEAAFFTVAIKPQEYVVGGVCDLGFRYEVVDAEPA